MKDDDNTKFNPLVWGILFFTFWLSLRTIGQLQTLQEVLSWFCLGLSVVLWLSIFIQPLRTVFDKPKARAVFLPVVFFVSIMSFALSLVGSLSDIGGFTRELSLVLGLLWIVAYFLVIVRSATTVRITRIASILASLTFVGFGIYRFINSQILAGALLVALGIASLVIIAKRPGMWHQFPPV